MGRVQGGSLEARVVMTARVERRRLSLFVLVELGDNEQGHQGDGGEQQDEDGGVAQRMRPNLDGEIVLCKQR